MKKSELKQLIKEILINESNKSDGAKIGDLVTEILSIFSTSNEIKISEANTIIKLLKEISVIASRID